MLINIFNLKLCAKSITDIALGHFSNAKVILMQKIYFIACNMSFIWCNFDTICYI